MKEFITRCDKCGKQGAYSYSVNKNRYTDAAGSGGTRTFNFDLCVGCVGNIFEKVLNDLDFRHDAAEKLKSLLGFEPKIYD